MGPILVSVVAAAVPVVLWRIQGATGATWLAWLAAVAAVIAIAISLAVGLRRNMAGEAGTPRRLGAMAALGAVVALVGSSTTLWPCTVACSAGAPYRELLGVHAGVVAGIILTVVAIIGLTQAHRTRINPIATLLAWTCVGGSAYYLILSAQLEMLCSACLAVHGVILCLPAALLAGGTFSPGERLAAVVIAALALHAWYHPIGDAAHSIRVEGELSTFDLRLMEQIDAGRRAGDPRAPLRAEISVGMSCAHCRDHLPALLRALEPAIATGRLHLVLRHQDLGRDGPDRVTLLALAAAAEGRHREFLSAFLGRLDEAADITAVDAALGPGWERLPEIADAYERPLLATLAVDAEHIKRRVLFSTPALALIGRDGEELGRWSGEIDIDAVLRTIERQTPIEL